jgi:hypothetical protein
VGSRVFISLHAGIFASRSASLPLVIIMAIHICCGQYEPPPTKTASVVFHQPGYASVHQGEIYYTLATTEFHTNVLARVGFH